MKCLVTGCAGFIGCHTAEQLLDGGHEVVGIDDLDPYYPRTIKKSNLESLRGRLRFQFVERDLNEVNLEQLLDGVDAVVHLAAQPGVRTSWGDSFSKYLRNNVLATQRLLQYCAAARLRTVVFAGSSSVYGAAERLPVDETQPPAPISPYGTTKLWAEQLCESYRIREGVPVVRLRYFSVYGPRQRPDMLFHRIIRAALTGATLEIYGTGDQTRDFTYVGDVARANCLAIEKGIREGVMNIGSGRPQRILDAVHLVEELSSRPVSLRFLPVQRGDPSHTHASTDRAKKILGFEPSTNLREGLAKQIEWQTSRQD